MEEKETERQKGKQRDKSSKRNKSQMASSSDAMPRLGKVRANKKNKPIRHTSVFCLSIRTIIVQFEPRETRVGRKYGR